MARNYIEINTEILKWAREELNLSYEQIGKKLQKSAADIESWEQGTKKPTYKQLEKLAYNVLKKPIAAFFLDEIPDSEKFKNKFRQLPDTLLNQTDYKTRLIINQMDYYRLVLDDLFGNEVQPNKFIADAGAKVKRTSELLAGYIREKLNLDFQTVSSFRNKKAAFKYYREAIEELGVYVFLEKLSDERAFCLSDEKFPVITLNSDDSDSSKIFSLFHELAHLLNYSNEILVDPNNAFYRNDPSEIYCNAVASEVLVPESEFIEKFKKRIKKEDFSENLVEEISEIYSVSKEVILRKMIDLGFVNPGLYKKYKSKWDKEYRKYKEIEKEKSKSKSGGPTYYTILKNRLSKEFTYKMLSKYNTGELNDYQLSEIFNIKADNIPTLQAKMI